MDSHAYLPAIFEDTGALLKMKTVSSILSYKLEAASMDVCWICTIQKTAVWKNYSQGMPMEVTLQEKDTAQLICT